MFYLYAPSFTRYMHCSKNCLTLKIYQSTLVYNSLTTLTFERIEDYVLPAYDAVY